MDYLQRPKFHYRPQRGWINDPNGLVYFKGRYHVFYQHAPASETPWAQPMHWGHAVTEDFLHWQELPPALCPDREYDRSGCWSGTAVVKDDVLYLFYASVTSPEGSEEKIQTVSMAYSRDGIHFEKYSGNPVIGGYPAEGGPDFRDPAVCCIHGEYYCVMATGHPETKTARLLLYHSTDLMHWDYRGIMCRWEQCVFAECPSFVQAGKDGFVLSVSVCPLEGERYFTVMQGDFDGYVFTPKCTARVDEGPDCYAGQLFGDHRGRIILISWLPGWDYAGFAERDIGCMSVPREIRLSEDGITAWPTEELCPMLTDADPCLERTDEGFVVRREGRTPVVHRGEISDIRIIRDGYIAEIFVNGGRQVYSVLL